MPPEQQKSLNALIALFKVFNVYSTTTPILKAEAESLGLPYIEEIPDSYLSSELTASIPVAWARTRCLLPVMADGIPSLLTSSPGDIESQQKASLAAGKQLRPIIAPPDVIASAIEKCYADAASERDGIIEETVGTEEQKADVSVNDLLDMSESAPVTRLVNTILLEAVKQRASDIHFEPFADKTVLRYRIDGVLYSRPSPPKHLEAALVSRLKVMAGMDIAEKRLPQDGMAQAKVGFKSIDIRVSTVPVADGERVVLRLLNRDDTLLPMSSLGMDSDLLKDFRSLLKTPNGIIIVSGPTGSGKTTTLYSALGEIDSDHRNVMTIEDPVEYRLPNIGQIQVKPKIGLTFASGLRHILRQDPDVVLVGETRDSETAEIAVRASLTGHLVFTTLHTNDAPSAVMRLVDMGIQPYLLASCLRGVLGQRLVRTLCEHCKELVDFNTASAGLDLPFGWAEKVGEAEFFTPVGCPSCLDGYSGRTGIFELMICTPELRAAIRNGCESSDDLRAAAVQFGMHQLADDALERVLEGVTDLSEVTGALTV